MPDRQQPRLVALSIRFYRLLLALYPRAHRREYGLLMLQSFRDLCRDGWRARGWRGLLGVWLRTLADLLQSAPAEHLAALGQGGAPMIENRPVTPLPWRQVALAVLPGLAVLLSTAPGVRVLGRLGRLLPGGLPLGVRSFPIAILAVAGLLIGLICIRRRRFPAWGLPALGALVGLSGAGGLALLALPAAAVYLAVRRQGLRRLPLWSWGLLGAAQGLSFLPLLAPSPLGVVSFWSLLGVGTTLGVIVLGVPLARHFGLVTGLVVAGAGYALWDGTFDLTYGLAGSFWAGAMLAVLALGLLVAAPIAVLRARSTHGQAWGLLAPTGVALACVVVVNTLVRTNPAPLEALLNVHPGLFSRLNLGLGISYGSLSRAPLLLRDGLAVVQLVLALVMGVVVYGRLGSQEGSRVA